MASSKWLLPIMVVWLVGCSPDTGTDNAKQQQQPQQSKQQQQSQQIDPLTIEIGLASSAKRLCSSVFVSGRSREHVMAEELSGPDMAMFDYAIDHATGLVEAKAPDGQDVKVLYREHLGCTLVKGTTVEKLRDQFDAAEYPPIPEASAALWPAGHRVEPPDTVPGVDLDAVNAAVDRSFKDMEPDQNIRTRGVVVVHDGKIIAEQYAPPFDAFMPQLGWSMTKTVTNALTGILVGDGKLDLNAPAPVPEWPADDPRSAITLNNLMHMSSGLDFSEVYTAESGSLSDVILMLYGPDAYAAGDYTAARKLAAPPGTRWYYSSGTTNLISRIHRQTFDDQQAYFNFPRARLFNAIGARSPVMEPDASGVFVGSSYMYATPRDWARIGLLFLEDGVWQGKRILPEGWVDYSLKPAPASPEDKYGAQIWLKPGMFYLSGFEGQNVVVVPGKNLIVVRLGLTTSGPRPIWRLVDEVAAAVSSSDQ